MILATATAGALLALGACSSSTGPIDGGAVEAAAAPQERATTTVTSDHELLNLVIKRSISDLRLLVNDMHKGR